MAMEPSKIFFKNMMSEGFRHHQFVFFLKPIHNSLLAETSNVHYPNSRSIDQINGTQETSRGSFGGKV